MKMKMRAKTRVKTIQKKAQKEENKKADDSNRSSRLDALQDDSKECFGVAKHLKKKKNQGTRAREEKRGGNSGEVARVATHDAQKKGKRLTRVTRSTGCVIHD